MGLNPESARLLRDKERGLHRPHTLLPQTGLRKHRELRFAKVPADQAKRASQLLAGLKGLHVEAGLADNSLSVWYDVTDYTMEGLEHALAHQGFHLSSSLYCKLVRALVHYSEETQLRNMRVPERLIKKSHEVYSKVWEHHPHGDRDDTPPDLREEK